MPNMAGYRRAAVALHDIHEEDRQWILAELADEERSTVARYLDELNALGFTPANATRQGMSLSGVLPASPKKPFDRIRQATAAQMFAVLAQEPSSLIAQVMAIGHWPWAPAFLQMFPPLRRERIRTALTGTAEPASARKQFLVDAIASNLKEQDTDSGLQGAATLWNLTGAAVLRQVVSPIARLLRSWKR